MLIEGQCEPYRSIYTVDEDLGLGPATVLIEASQIKSTIAACLKLLLEKTDHHVKVKVYYVYKPGA